MSPALLTALFLAALVVCALSGLPALVLHGLRRAPAWGEWLAVALMAAGCGLGLVVTGVVLAGPPLPAGSGLSLPWPVPGGAFAVGVDGLSGVFLAPMFLVMLLGSIYGLSYWRPADHPSAGRVRFFYGWMAAGLGLLFSAKNGIVFLFGWEIMALSDFFLVSAEDEKAQARQAGWLYLVATHCGMLLLFALFTLLASVTGTFALLPLAAGGLSPGMTWAVLLLALGGFGLKAGIMPLHVWLPTAHANAPTHVSAAMSGLLIKAGIYGLCRVLWLLPEVPGLFGALLLVLGMISAVAGVACALGQHDLKRLLAYHSIENIGIITIGLGLAVIGRATGRAEWVLLGMAGALLHVVNHGLFKSLLFLAAGAVIQQTGTRQIDDMGGLLRVLPRTALLFLLGAVAICGLPPLNGFVSEFFLYLGLFRAVQAGSGLAWVLAALAAPALALAGALAVACFVKVMGVVFLGQARAPRHGHGHGEAPSMVVPMAVLALACLVIGVVPIAAAQPIGRAVRVWAPELIGDDRVVGAALPLLTLTWLGLGLCGGALAIAIWLRWRGRAAPAAGTWDCGYAAPSPSMQYTASSFAQVLVDLFAPVLRPEAEGPPRHPIFIPSAEARFHSHVPDTVLDGMIVPGMRAIGAGLSRLRVLQQGSIHAYLLYLVMALLLLLLWTSVSSVLGG